MPLLLPKNQPELFAIEFSTQLGQNEVHDSQQDQRLYILGLALAQICPTFIHHYKTSQKGPSQSIRYFQHECQLLYNHDPSVLCMLVDEPLNFFSFSCLISFDEACQKCMDNTCIFSVCGAIQQMGLEMGSNHSFHLLSLVNKVGGFAKSEIVKHSCHEAWELQPKSNQPSCELGKLMLLQILSQVHHQMKFHNF